MSTIEAISSPLFSWHSAVITEETTGCEGSVPGERSRWYRHCCLEEPLPGHDGSNDRYKGAFSVAIAVVSSPLFSGARCT